MMRRTTRTRGRSANTKKLTCKHTLDVFLEQTVEASARRTSSSRSSPSRDTHARGGSRRRRYARRDGAGNGHRWSPGIIDDDARFSTPRTSLATTTIAGDID